MKIKKIVLFNHARHLGDSLRGVLHIHHSAGHRCSSSPWNDHASLSRLASRRDEHALHLVQLRLLG